MDILLRLAIVLVLVLANAFFVAAEFALVAVRRSRIDEMAARGDAGARVVQRTFKDLDRSISATHLGIPLPSLALVWLCEEAIAALVYRVFVHLGYTAPATAIDTTAATITA